MTHPEYIAKLREALERARIHIGYTAAALMITYSPV